MMMNDKPFDIEREKLHVLYGSTKVILDRMAMKKLESEFYQTLQNVINGATELS